MREEPLIYQNTLELDNSKIEIGDIIYIHRASDFTLNRIASRNYIVQVENILSDNGYIVIKFKDKEDILLFENINDVAKLKTYSYDEINYKPGDLFFSTRHVELARKKNIVYESVEGYGDDRVYYMPYHGEESCSISNFLNEIKFINVNNNLSLKSNQNNTNNSYMKLIKSLVKE